MEREPNLTNRRRRKNFREEDRSYGADYGRAYGDEWSASYSQYDQFEPIVGRGYDSDQFFVRRERDPRQMPENDGPVQDQRSGRKQPAQGRKQGGFGGPSRYKRRIERSQAW